MGYPPPAPPYVGPPYHQTPGSNKPIRRIVLHGTVSATVAGGARETANYFRSPTAGGSAHYVVDPREVVQAAWDSVICWHAPPNEHSLGIELCDWVGGGAGRSTPLPVERWNDAEHAAMLALAARLVAELCLAYDVPRRMLGPVGLRLGLRGICEHADVSQAWHQSTHWDLGNFPRRQFIHMVRREVRRIKAGQPPSPSPTKPVRLVDRAQQVLRNNTPAAAHRRQRHHDDPRPSAGA